MTEQVTDAATVRSDAATVGEVLQRLRSGDDPYLEFLRVPSLSVGLYVLPAGGTDRQSPHGEDEIYVVLEGRAALRVEHTLHQARPGSVLFVAAGVEHRFESIEEELRTLVVFAPAEGSGLSGTGDAVDELSPRPGRPEGRRGC